MYVNKAVRASVRPSLSVKMFVMNAYLIFVVANLFKGVSFKTILD